MCDIKECRASERGWRRSCGDRGIHRAGEYARRVGESSRGNWYVRVGDYADTVSPVKMREFRRNYLHHGSSKTFLFGSREGYANRFERSTGTRSGKGQDFDLRVGLGSRLSGSQCPGLIPQHAKRYRSRPSRREPSFYSSSHVAAVGDCRTGGRGAVLHRVRAHPFTTIIPLTPTHRGHRLSLD